MASEHKETTAASTNTAQTAKRPKREDNKAKGVRSLFLLMKLILFYQETGHDLYQ